MKYFMLIWAGLWRKRIRTLFTMASITIAFLLFGLLQGVNKGFENVSGGFNVNRLYTESKSSMVQGMPISHANRIKTIQGVTGVSHLTYFGGFYQDKHNSIGVFAADVPALFKMYPEFSVPQERIDAMRTIRAGALISRNLSTKYGWQVGDKVPIGTSIWTKKDGRNDYQFEIAGIFDFVGIGASGPNSFYINFDYFDEERQFGNGTVHYFITGMNDPDWADSVSRSIDEQFSNSGDETKTQSAQVFLGSRLKQLADINYIVVSIVGAVLFTLLCITGNTMMQSINDRIPELGVLKALGFTDGKVAIFVVCESFMLCILSAAMGLALAWLSFIPLSKVLGNIEFKAAVVYAGLAMATGLAVVTGVLPAVRTKRLTIVDALAGR